MKKIAVVIVAALLAMVVARSEETCKDYIDRVCLHKLLERS